MLNNHMYDDCKNLIKKMRKNGEPWESIKYAKHEGKDRESKLKSYLKDKEFRDYWPPLSIEKWFEIVNAVRSVNEEAEKFEEKSSSSMVEGAKQNNDTEVPSEYNSSWQSYKKRLAENGIDDASIVNIEKECSSILKKLDSDTENKESIKGLVVGNVQSGKTANMAGLMAMASDNGWNMFIVLSGLVENLRVQTQERLINDLSNRTSNIHWISLSNVQKNCDPGNRAKNMIFDSLNKKIAHLYVCLKNKNRLENLLQWLHDDLNIYNKMKILVIDDEADQGSINTASNKKEEERKTINRLIVNLVENKSYKGENLRKNAKAMNYVSYTATPYANFLNETGRESLYPKDFIRTLSTSNRYFGPKEIFGVEETDHNGLDIIRNINEKDALTIAKIHNSEEVSMPQSLLNSICWFLSSVASLRVHGYKKPLTMLVHTSHLKSNHKAFYNLIKDWIEQTPNREILKKCRMIWESERKKFTINDLKDGYPDYGAFETVMKPQSFDEIEPAIASLISEVTNIPINEEQDFEFQKHIHLCVDNSDHNGISDDNMYLRLSYPNKEKNKELDTATAFIVVGGTTLSRGLTIQGLLSTYFVRGGTQADTLMQMGRWFGYRLGYELYPRIWMENETRLKFDFLSTLEHEMRVNLKSYDLDSASPEDIAPKIKNTPGVSWLRVTARNRMQSAETIDFDYSGSSNQTILFNNDEEELKSNFINTEKFIEQFKGRIIEEKNKLIIKEVDFELINSLFKDLRYPSSSRLFNDVELPKFVEWVETQSFDKKLDKWNVIVSGVSTKNANRTWTIGDTGYSVGMVTRSGKPGYVNKDLINIGVLRSPSDLVADIDISELSSESRKIAKEDTLSIKNKKLWMIRNEAGLGKTPQLIIYPIDRNSTKPNPRKDAQKNITAEREDLKAKFDLIGIAITLPSTEETKEHGSLRARLTED